MKIIDVALGAALALSTVSPALAARNVAPKAESASPAAASSTFVAPGVTGSGASERLVCRKQETTGSRTGGERLCLTKKQWRTLDNGGSVVLPRSAATSRR